MLSGSRGLLEALVRRRTLELPNVKAVTCRAHDLVIRDGAATGVWCADSAGNWLEEADFVVDAMGRSSRLSEWLERSGWERERERRRRDERFHNYDSRREFPINETSRLIASNKVEGTPVYSRRGGHRLGSIYNFMVDKRSGRVEYAVLAYGGFLGMGQDYFPLPWDMLTYDTREDGYVVDIDERELERAPRYRRGEEPRYDEEYARTVGGYWGGPMI